MKRLFILLLFAVISVSIFADSMDSAKKYIQDGEYEEAIPILENLVRKEKDYAVAYLNLAYCYFHLGKNEKALVYYQRAYDLSGSLDSVIGLQWTYLALKNYSRSLEFGRIALEIDPSNYSAELGIADAFFAQEKFTDALQSYLKIERKFGTKEYILQQKSLCYEKLGNEERADEIKEALFESSPKNPYLRYSLGLEPKTPYFYLTPEFAGFAFYGSKVIGNGSKSGIRMDFGFNDSFAFRLGYQNSISDNLYAKNGVNQYIFDEPFNNLQYYLYRYDLNSIRSYLTLPLNLYNMYSIASSKDFLVNSFDAGVTYRYSHNWRVSINAFNAQSPGSSILGNASAGKITLEYGSSLKIGISAGGSTFPTARAGQADLYFLFPFLKYFYSYSAAIGQTVQKQQTDYLLYSTNPVTTLPIQSVAQLNYALGQQEFGFANSWFYFGVGGKFGTGFAPMIGDAWIYTPFTYYGGGYGYIGKNLLTSLNFKLEYSGDYWKDSLGANTVSNLGKISITVRF